jgi:two-component system LytT family response regulator
MKKDYIVVTTARNSKKKIFTEDIVYIEADGSYSIIHLKDDLQIILSKLLKTFCFLCENNNFLRVSRSNIINLNHTRDLIKSNKSYVIMSNNDKIHIYQKYFDLLDKNEFSINI